MVNDSPKAAEGHIGFAGDDVQLISARMYELMAHSKHAILIDIILASTSPALFHTVSRRGHFSHINFLT